MPMKTRVLLNPFKPLYAALATLLLAVPAMPAHAQFGYKRLQSFAYQDNSGVAVATYPQGDLLKGSDGTLYGTTSGGVEQGGSSIFKINPDGSGYMVLTNVESWPEGAGPMAGLIQGKDGALYGTSYTSRDNPESGLTFKVNPNGTGFTVLHRFIRDSINAQGSTVRDGTGPAARLLQGPDGALYGTTDFGGANDTGIIFKMNMDGAGYTNLYDFPPLVPTPEYRPHHISALIQATDGALYGASSDSGDRNHGAVFKINPDGTAFTFVHSFGGVDADGVCPTGDLMQGQDGALYGTTEFRLDIPDDLDIISGEVFRLNTDGTGYQVLHAFWYSGGHGSSGLKGRLAQGPDGTLYGTTEYGGSEYSGSIFCVGPDGSNFREFYSFGTGPGDGDVLTSGLLMDGDRLYGTTVGGGDQSVGVVFEFNLCSCAFSSTSISLPYGAGSGSFDVSNTNGCAWTALASDEWIHTSSSGAGSGAVNFTVDPNMTVASRTGSISIGLQIFTVIQDSPPVQTVTSTAGPNGRMAPLGARTVVRGGQMSYSARANTNYVIDQWFVNEAVVQEGGTKFILANIVADTTVRVTFRAADAINHPPVAFAAPAIVSAGANCMANASVDNGSSDPDGDPITITQSPAGPYPIGTNLVTLTVTDSHGASSSATSYVIVRDTTPPQITCPANITVEFTSEKGAVVTFNTTATDDCSGAVVLCQPASGSTFPIGITTVTCGAMDGAQNMAMSSFQVTVLGSRGGLQNVERELAGTKLNSAKPGLVHKLDPAAHLAAALDSAYWLDETHLRPNGHVAFEEIQTAISQMQSVKGLPEGSIDRTLKSARLLAALAVENATGNTGRTLRLEYSVSELSKGDRQAGERNPVFAIEHYRNAWEAAQGR